MSQFLDQNTMILGIEGFTQVHEYTKWNIFIVYIFKDLIS